ncbi:hypothetical protein GCK72_004055 [Caenorhabditis remanei]|uniref:U1-C C2H2-type zinc finger domain-containing protein n=1 Tax=Caenorhabditis remanei TaxID=31234 RepID=A0A6A5HAL4_CAERE|nr:hypothetical protein GCK72_004055 [Caenorhabditis remanei]KAF1764109.1 hypothetical protein GCK72_004055 [Caenorhabditis remanei]
MERSHFEPFDITKTSLVANIYYCEHCQKIITDASQASRKNHNKLCAAKCRRCGVLNCATPTLEDLSAKYNKKCDTCRVTFHAKACYESHLVKSSSPVNPKCNCDLFRYVLRKDPHTFQMLFAVNSCAIIASGCHHCGQQHQFTYKDEATKGQAMKQFVEFMCNDIRFNNCIILAHNDGKYDHSYILAEVTGATPNILMNGNQIIQAEVVLNDKIKITFEDTLVLLANGSQSDVFGFEMCQ